jgi:hypothetical protein
MLMVRRIEDYTPVALTSAEDLPDYPNNVLKFFFGLEPTVLVSGNDFYAFPRIDPTDKRMAWIEWSNPNMSWDKAQLWVGYFSSKG